MTSPGRRALSFGQEFGADRGVDGEEGRRFSPRRATRRFPETLFPPFHVLPSQSHLVNLTRRRETAPADLLRQGQYELLIKYTLYRYVKKIG